MTIDPATDGGAWEGWGCSLAWWANVFGDRDDMADALFTTGAAVSLTTSAGACSLPGLGMTIARYNIGGTGYDTDRANGAAPNNPPRQAAFKRIAGFWIDGDSADPASPSWDWTRDANQRRMLEKARDRGADLFEAFSDAPPWWMAGNHSTAGSDSGGDNLLREHHDRFADYLATVVAYARDHWGVTFPYVEPFNEPAADWWKYPSTQEGCHFDVATQKTVIAKLRSVLDARGLSGVAIAASDENSPDAALATWNAFDAATRDRVAKVNTHGYSGLDAYRGPNRGPLHAATAGKRLWVTEYGEDDASGMTMADSIARDLREMHPTAWVYWQPFDGGGWGLVQSNPGDHWVGPPNPKYYVFAQFSRHIRPGMRIVGSGDRESVAAYDAAGHKLAVVTVNSGTARWIDYDLSRFGTVSGPVTRWRTQTGGGEMYRAHRDTVLNGKRFRSWSPADTVQTFEIQGVHR